MSSNVNVLKINKKTLTLSKKKKTWKLGNIVSHSQFGMMWIQIKDKQRLINNVLVSLVE